MAKAYRVQICKVCSKSDAMYDENIMLRRENERLRAENTELRRSQSVINNYQVNIVNFSAEPQLSRSEVEKLLKPADESIRKYIKLKHFVHGGGNVRIPNINANRAQVYEGGEWLEKDKKTLIDSIKCMSLEELTDKYQALDNEDFKDWYWSYSQLQKHEQNELNKEILFEILNNQRKSK